MSSGLAPRIVQVVHRLDVGGLENGVVNLVNRIPPERYRNTIVCLAGYSDGFRRRIARDDVEVISLDKRPGKDLPMYGRMWRALRRRRPAIVHTRNVEHATRMARRLNTTLLVQNAASTASLGVNGPGYFSHTIATPTGEGVTTPMTFTRERQFAVGGALRFI